MAAKLNDKDMATDLLKSMDDGTVFYATVINHATNTAFRDTVIRLRNADEAFLYELSHMADRKGFHDEGPSAPTESIQDVKEKLNVSAGCNQSGGCGC
jgi:hypothetical protein